MKNYLSKIIPVFIILWIFLCGPGMVADSSADQKKGAGVKKESTNVGYLENVLFDKSKGRERVSLIVSEQPLLAPPSIQADNSLLIKLENLFVPDSMRHVLGKGQLLN